MKKKISFCTTCKNRKWQLEKTLLNNLNALDDECEIVLIDYISKDSLSKWIWENFKSFIQSGKLVFFELKTKLPWNVSVAKNLAHRLANGKYLFNLDADNFIDHTDIIYLKNYSKKNIAVHQYTNIKFDGSYGRIGLSKKLFFQMGGYNECLLPMGAQDIDLIHRLNLMKIKICKKKLPTKEAIRNNFNDKIINFYKKSKNPDIDFKLVNKLNKYLSATRCEIEGPIISFGYTTCEGLLNKKSIRIDGRNNITLIK